MQETVDIGFQFLRLAGSLLLVLLTLFLGFYGLKKWGHWMKRSDPNPWIQVLAQHAFGPKHFLMVVKIQQQSFLVGVSPQGMNMLSPLNAVDTPCGQEVMADEDGQVAHEK